MFTRARWPTLIKFALVHKDRALRATGYAVSNPYHNALHASDVTANIDYFLRQPNLQAPRAPLSTPPPTPLLDEIHMIRFGRGIWDR